MTKRQKHIINYSMDRKNTAKAGYTTIDEYIALFSDDIQKILKKIRAVIRKAAPQAVEKISWQMPTYHQGENLIHFAAMKNHIGLYPGAEGVAAFNAELEGYQTSKGAIRFPLSKPIPYDLIAKIARFRVQAAEAKTRGGR